jgi:hypothetical protein
MARNLTRAVKQLVSAQTIEEMWRFLEFDLLPVLIELRARFQAAFGPAVIVDDTTYIESSVQYYLADASAAPVTLYLPEVSGEQAEAEYVVKKIDSSGNNVTIYPSGLADIDGASSKVISTQWDSLRFITDGEDWYLV